MSAPLVFRGSLKKPGTSWPTSCCSGPGGISVAPVLMDFTTRKEWFHHCSALGAGLWESLPIAGGIVGRSASQNGGSIAGGIDPGESHSASCPKEPVRFPGLGNQKDVAVSSPSWDGGVDEDGDIEGGGVRERVVGQGGVRYLMDRECRELAASGFVSSDRSFRRGRHAIEPGAEGARWPGLDCKRGIQP